jgi:hypothetical protein
MGPTGTWHALAVALPTPLRRAARWLERALLGAAMTLVAVVIERRVLKAIRKGSGPEPVHAPGRVTVATAPTGNSPD